MTKINEKSKISKFINYVIKETHMSLFSVWSGLGVLRWGMWEWVWGLGGGFGLGRSGFGLAGGCC